MTIKTELTCDGCGKSIQPSAGSAIASRSASNHGWVYAMVVGPDGVNFVDCAAHLCDDCRVDFRRWVNDHLKSKQQKVQ